MTSTGKRLSGRRRHQCRHRSTPASVAAHHVICKSIAGHDLWPRDRLLAVDAAKCRPLPAESVARSLLARSARLPQLISCSGAISLPYKLRALASPRGVILDYLRRLIVHSSSSCRSDDVISNRYPTRQHWVAFAFFSSFLPNRVVPSPNTFIDVFQCVVWMSNAFIQH